MSKQHFEWAARYVRQMVTDGMAFDEVTGAREGFVHLFRQFGPRFDEGRFREACGR